MGSFDLRAEISADMSVVLAEDHPIVREFVEGHRRWERRTPGLPIDRTSLSSEPLPEDHSIVLAFINGHRRFERRPAIQPSRSRP